MTACAHPRLLEMDDGLSIACETPTLATQFADAIVDALHAVSLPDVEGLEMLS